MCSSRSHNISHVYTESVEQKILKLQILPIYHLNCEYESMNDEKNGNVEPPLADQATI